MKPLLIIALCVPHCISTQATHFAAIPQHHHMEPLTQVMTFWWTLQLLTATQGIKLAATPAHKTTGRLWCLSRLKANHAVPPVQEAASAAVGQRVDKNMPEPILQASNTPQANVGGEDFPGPSTASRHTRTSTGGIDMLNYLLAVIPRGMGRH